MPAVDQHELGVAPVERRLEPLAVLADRHAREVRRQHDADQARRIAGERPVHRLHDPRPPVLHADEDRDPELALQRRALRLGDLVERRATADPPVALGQLGDRLVRDRPAAPDVLQVRPHILRRRRAPIRHQHDRVAHSATCLFRPRPRDSPWFAGHRPLSGSRKLRTVSLGHGRGLSPGPVLFGRRSRGHQRRLVDQLHQPPQQVRIGLREHAVAEVEDVARPAARALEHVARAGLDPLPRARAGRRRRGCPGCRGRGRPAPRRRPAERASRRRSHRRRPPRAPRADARRRSRSGSSAPRPRRALEPSRARRTRGSRRPRARRPTSRTAGSRPPRRRRRRRRTARTRRRASPSAHARPPAASTCTPSSA